MALNSTIRLQLKNIVESTLSSPPLASVGLRLRVRSRLNLAYHNVVDRPAKSSTGDTSLHLPISGFIAQLDAIQEARLVVRRVDEPRDPNGATAEVAVTFDDACAGALSMAVPLLAERGIPATIFVAPGLLGGSAPWWDRLAVASQGAVPPAVRDIALGQLKGRHEVVMAAAALRGWPTLEPDRSLRIATEREIETALGAHPKLTVGAHSWYHPNLTSLTEAELDDELARPLAWLRQRWPERIIPWLAYPYGLESPTVRRAASGAGYEGGLLVRGGWYREAPDPFGTPRLNVGSGLSINGFKARLNGFISG